jgi:chitodextrinase
MLMLGWRVFQKKIARSLLLTPILLVTLTSAASAAAPQPPTDLRVKSVATMPMMITIAWKASTSSNIAQYLIFRDDVQIASVSGKTLSYNDKDLIRAAKYIYSIKAKNTSGQLSAAAY